MLRILPALFKLHRAEVAQRRMQPAVIVESHPAHQCLPQLTHGLQTCAHAHWQLTVRSRSIASERCPENCPFCSLMSNPPDLQRILELPTAILGSPVAVEYQTSRWAPAPPRHGHRRLRLPGVHLAHHLQLELARLLRTHLLRCHLLTPCRYFQQG